MAMVGVAIAVARRRARRICSMGWVVTAYYFFRLEKYQGRGFYFVLNNNFSGWIEPAYNQKNFHF